ncbi:hypothetical protein AMTR_s00294p00014750 [Amborella trichopoda]|uniref:Uncharacterized protein n=1 Tax=Amborella trichopoda TaxID=13333 RepID=W1PR73_AMBTC|nr:hypothetical protein AMTR_s00294p00014750 [Amborella trichopoda]
MKRSARGHDPNLLTPERSNFFSPARKREGEKVGALGEGPVGQTRFLSEFRSPFLDPLTIISLRVEGTHQGGLKLSSKVGGSDRGDGDKSRGCRKEGRMGGGGYDSNWGPHAPCLLSGYNV